MSALVIGLIVFLGIHSIRVCAPDLRQAGIGRFGEIGYKIGYSAISLIGLVLIVHGYVQARLDPIWLYQPPPALRHLNMLLMLVVFPALLAAYWPGAIQNKLKHPMLVAVKAWALAHLLVNGTLADILLFGGFLVWAVLDRISLARRPQASPPQLPRTRFNDAVVIGGGLALYAAFAFWLHPLLFGVAVTG